MKIQVGKLKNVKFAEAKVQQTALVEAAAYGYGEIALLKPLAFVGEIKNIGEFLELTGVVSGQAELVCSCCLEPFAWKFEIPVAETYTNQQEVAEADPEEELIFFSGDEIDIAPQLLKLIFLELPMKAVCQPSCKGLCSNCGANLNLGDCSCNQQDIDLRLEKLKDLLNTMDKGV